MNILLLNTLELKIYWRNSKRWDTRGRGARRSHGGWQENSLEQSQEEPGGRLKNSGASAKDFAGTWWIDRGSREMETVAHREGSYNVGQTARFLRSTHSGGKSRRTLNVGNVPQVISRLCRAQYYPQSSIIKVVICGHRPGQGQR